MEKEKKEFLFEQVAEGVLSILVLYGYMQNDFLFMAIYIGLAVVLSLVFAYFKKREKWYRAKKNEGWLQPVLSMAAIGFVFYAKMNFRLIPIALLLYAVVWLVLVVLSYRSNFMTKYN